MMTDPTPDDLLARSLSPGDLPSPGASLELLAQAKGGDRAALEELIRRYQDRLQRVVRIQLGASALRRHVDSMDIVQSTFRAALPRILDLEIRGPASLLQWLATLATNQIRDTARHHRAGKRDMGREVAIDDADEHALPASAELPLERALLAEVRELLDDAVAALPDDQRRAVILRDYCGEDWPRIAADLGREIGAARQLHQRAWIRLRSALRPKLESNLHRDGDRPGPRPERETR